MTLYYIVQKLMFFSAIWSLTMSFFYKNIDIYSISNIRSII